MGIQYEQNNNFTRWLDSLDKRFWKPSIRELIIMFGYSGIGKTEYTYFVARSNAEKWNLVYYLSLELPEYDMKQRICLSKAWVSKYMFQTNNFNDYQRDKMNETWSELENLTNMKILSPQNKWIRHIIEYIRKWHQEWCNMFVLDNLDKIWWDWWDNENSRYQLITSQLQDLKNELNICIILIHHARKQLNKQQAMMKAWLEWMRGNQKIIDNSTQVFEVFRELDQDDDDFKNNISEIIQLKDTFWWPKWYEKIQYHWWTYREYLPDNNKK